MICRISRGTAEYSGRHNIRTEACLWCGLGDPVLKSSFLAMVEHCLHTTSIPYDVGSYDFQSDADSTTIAQETSLQTPVASIQLQ